MSAPAELDEVLMALCPAAPRLAVLGDLALARALADRGARVLATQAGAAPRQLKKVLKPARGAAPPALLVLRAHGLPVAAGGLDGIIAAEPPAELATLVAALAPGRRLVLVSALAGAPGLPGWLGGRAGVARETHTRALLSAGLTDVRQVVIGRVGKLIVSHAQRG